MGVRVINIIELLSKAFMINLDNVNATRDRCPNLAVVGGAVYSLPLVGFSTNYSDIPLNDESYITYHNIERDSLFGRNSQAMVWLLDSFDMQN